MEQKQALDFKRVDTALRKEYIEKGYASKLHNFFIYISDMVCHHFIVLTYDT